MKKTEWNSSEENIIAQILNMYDIPYIHDKVLFDLYTPNGGHPKVDFMIYLDNGDFVFVEYQGKQHYVEDPDNPEFGRYQREVTDPLKRWYCREKRIPLYEISYLENTRERLLDILVEIDLVKYSIL